MSWLLLALVLLELSQPGFPGGKFEESSHELSSQHPPEECKAIASTGPDIPNCKSKEVIEHILSPYHRHFQAPDCLPYWAILVLRVAALPPPDLDYMLQFMDHNQDRDMEGVEEQVNTVPRILKEDSSQGSS